MSYIQAIKIAQKQLKIDQDTHVLNVLDVSDQRVSSCTKLSPRQQRVLLTKYRSMLPAKKPFTLPKQVQLIYSLWTQLHQVGAVKTDSKQACDAYCEKRLGGKAIIECPSKWGTIIESLKSWKARVVAENCHE